MSAAESWDLRVPRDAAELEELWAEARRHGVEPGGHLRVVSSHVDEAVIADTPQRELTFLGIGHDGPADLSTNTDRYLAEGFGAS